MATIKKPIVWAWRNPLRDMYQFFDRPFATCGTVMCGGQVYLDWGALLDIFTLGGLVEVEDDELPEGITNRLWLTAVKACDRCWMRTNVILDYTSQEDYDEAVTNMGAGAGESFIALTRALIDLIRDVKTA